MVMLYLTVHRGVSHELGPFCYDSQIKDYVLKFADDTTIVRRALSHLVGINGAYGSFSELMRLFHFNSLLLITENI